MGHTSDLLTGLAQLLENAGVGVFADTYASTDVGIGLQGLPELCDRAVAVTDYSTRDDYPNQALTTVGFQTMFRGLPDDRASMLDIRDAAYMVLQNLTYAQCGSALIIQVLRTSSVPLGRDDHDRWLMSDNWIADLSITPTANRP